MKAGLAMSGLVVVLMLAFAGAAGARHEPGQLHAQATKRFWHPAPTLRASARLRPALSLRGQLHTFALERAGLQRALLNGSTAVVALPRPDGTFQRFALRPSAIMAPGLARRHPEIHTYAGRGIDDPSASIHADLSRIGFHASIRSAHGGWYVDPYYRNEPAPVRHLLHAPGRRPARDLRRARPARSRSGHAAPRGDGRPAPHLPPRPADRSRLRDLLRRRGQRHRGEGHADQPRDQIYEDETSIRLALIANNDLLNLNTDAEMTGANGPCGGAPCFTTAQATDCTGSTLTRNRHVHRPARRRRAASTSGTSRSASTGGGIASLGVVGGNSKAQGCTGLPTPVGDFFAVDYVAHEMGHQFAGNHTFNGTQSNCGGGNRNGSTSVEPGSGSSIMAYAGICGTDNLQPHSDPYWSERSFDEITSLRLLGGDGHLRGPDRRADELRRDRPVPAALPRQRLGADRARDELHRRRDPGRHPDHRRLAGRRHRGRQRRQRHVLHGHLRRQRSPARTWTSSSSSTARPPAPASRARSRRAARRRGTGRSPRPATRSRRSPRPPASRSRCGRRSR